MREPGENLIGSFHKKLNAHGYAFQQAVLKEIRNLHSWRTAVAEFPVRVQGVDYHIDIVLKNKELGLWMVCECKRLDPAINDWCFFREFRSDHGILANQVFAECVGFPDRDGSGTVSITKLHRSESIYQRGMPLKGLAKGDGTHTGKDDIESAITQALRGLNGFLSWVAHSDKARATGGYLSVLPVVFTTANLWSSDVDLGLADLKKGEINSEFVSMKPEKWLWYHYAQSAGLKHSLGVRDPGYDFEDFIVSSFYSDFVRSVAIVNATNIRDFLEQSEFRT